MTLSIHWLLDPAADPQRSEPSRSQPLPDFARDRRSPDRNRFDYYIQVATGAAQTGFDGVLVRHRIEADESRTVAAAIARAVPDITVTAQFPASVGSAVYAAKQAATLQRATTGRFGWAVAPDADAAERRREADYVADEDLPARLDEFLTVARGVHGQSPFSFRGNHFEVENGGFDAPLNRYPFPHVILEGASEAALAVSARHADVHLFRPATPAALAERIGRLHAAAQAHGRSVAAGLFQPVGHDLDDAAETIFAAIAVGIEVLVLESGPQLEAVYRIGQNLLPSLRGISLTPAKVA